jgi:uncharacterized integral membrane protein (TIGR00698 family)
MAALRRCAGVPAWRGRLQLIPGIALCLAITLAARLLQVGEEAVTGHPYVEALVLAIIVGTVVRTFWTPSAVWRPGIHVSAKLLLEIAVTLLGASVSLHAVTAAGPKLLLGIVAVVAISLVFAYWVCRFYGLPPRMSVLVACGNSICGNSAIAAVAPVIGAHADDIASSIAFTAILGVIVVLGLPLLMPVLGLSNYGFGVLAGLMVYAVPQVLAATAPVSALSLQVGTLVKLVRVLMLGPVVLGVSLLASRIVALDRPPATAASPGMPAPRRMSLHRMVPWFIIGFLVLATLRSLGLLPDILQGPIAFLTTWLTVISMAALGLGVDVRIVGKVGGRAIAAVSSALLMLLLLSIIVIRVLGIV